MIDFGSTYPAVRQGHRELRLLKRDPSGTAFASNGRELIAFDVNNGTAKQTVLDSITANEAVRRFCPNASGAFCAPTGLQLLFNRKDGGFHGIATALGITLMDKGFIVFWNFSFITSQAQGNVVAHELAHQFTLLDTFWVGPSNLMCGGNNPTCPPLPSDYLDKDQIQRAQDGAKQWIIH